MTEQLFGSIRIEAISPLTAARDGKPFPEQEGPARKAGRGSGFIVAERAAFSKHVPIGFSRNCLPDMEKRESDDGSNGRFQDRARTD